MNTMRFIKYHGLGNDFILMDWTGSTFPFSKESVPMLCDRHMGIGADGILLVETGTKTSYRMKIYNSDGSEAEMCGNGIRCFAKYLRDYRHVKDNPVDVETGKGVLSCLHVGAALHGGDEIQVSMGKPILEREKIPMSGTGDILNQTIIHEGRSFLFHAVSMGNPHMVLFGDATRATAEKYGPSFSRHPLFPKETNVEFARVRTRSEIELTVYERGCGITMACGTGACATVVAACLNGFVDFDTPVSVHLPGGALKIQVDNDLSDVLMTGPAVEVFRGEMLDIS